MPFTQLPNRYNHNHRIRTSVLGQRKASHSRRFHDTHNLSSPYRRSLTGYKCNLFRLFSRFYAHDLCDLFSNRLTAHRTGIDRRFPFGNCCRQICTARITAAAAVISRKLVLLPAVLFINFYCKFFPANPRKSPRSSPVPPTITAASMISMLIRHSSFLFQTGKSKECDRHQTGCKKNDR